jgi:DNA-binding PadR family transcriptional regulator
MFGLEIIDQSAGLLKSGTIYVTLQRMEEKNLVE